MTFDLKNKISTQKINFYIRYALSVILIAMGIILMISKFLAGMYLILSGIFLNPSLWKQVYEKTKLLKFIQKINTFKFFRYIPIILSLMFSLLSIYLICSAPNTQEKISDNSPQLYVQPHEEKIPVEEVDVKISKLKIDSDKNIKFNIQETPTIVLKFSPPNANTNELEFISSDDSVATLDKSEKTQVTIRNNYGELSLNINLMSEGHCTLFVKSNSVESNKIKVTITDEEKFEKQEDESLKTENNEPEENKEESNNQATEQKTQKQQLTTTNPSQKISNNNNPSQNLNNIHEKETYRTPRGKKYHFDPDCGGKNSYKTTLEEAKNSGLTPCKKCVH